ncbi:MAG TPA: cytochrome P450 [Gaiellaceae bacterium]
MAEARDLVPQVELVEAEEEARRARFPAGAALEFADLEEQGRAGALDRLREVEPVSWVPALGGWLVTSYPLGRNVLARTDDFTVWAQPNLVRASLGVMMLTSDPPDHERQRQPFDEPFRMRSVRERFEARVSARVERLLDEMEPRGSCELVVDFAAPFAIGVAGDILGLSLDDVPKIHGFYEAFAGAMTYDGDPEPQRRADAAREAFSQILLAEVARVRERPDDSITSAVTNDPATQLTDEAIVAQLRVILFGAIETVESMIVNAVLLLLGHPDQLGAVRADPGLVPNAVEEAMRLIPPVAFIERWTAGPTTLGNVELGGGEFVGVSTFAANRDPEVFEDPLAFDVRRENARHHLAFSFGVHHCLGFNMARLQGPLAVKAILDRLSGLEIVEAPEPCGFAFRRPPELRLRWASASAA